MRNLMPLCAWLYAVAFVVAVNPAHAGNNSVSYVSNNGNDSNDCSSPALACLDFATALAKTINYGEIDCVDTGDYGGGFTVTQSVTIDCAGAIGAMTTAQFGGTGSGTIIVNGSGIVVRLRNLSFNYRGFGVGGIDALNMAALYIENCVITNYNAANSAIPPYLGIKFEPSANAQLFVTNSVISDNGYSGSGGISGGIYIVPASGVTANVSIDHSQINGNVFGIVADGTAGGTVRGVIKDSVVSGNTENGITAHTSGSNVWVLVDQTAVSGNLYGLVAGGNGAEILARNTTVFNNTTGLFTNNGGTLYSYGNNSINGNTTKGTFTGTVGLE